MLSQVIVASQAILELVSLQTIVDAIIYNPIASTILK
jgi:hypothetical protein